MKLFVFCHLSLLIFVFGSGQCTSGTTETCNGNGDNDVPISATAKLCNGVAHGTIIFSQKKSGLRIRIHGKIEGLPEGIYTLDIHSGNDISNSCANIGPHVDAPGDYEDAGRHHLGQLGVVRANEKGEATVHLKDRYIKFTGPQNILNKTLAIHVGEPPEDCHTNTPVILCGVILSDFE